jgi:VWFA-related protein
MTYFAPRFRHSVPKFIFSVLLAFCLAAPVSSGQSTPSTTQGQTADQQKQQQQQQNPAAGGPQGDIGPIAVPKKKTDDKPAEKPEKQEKVKNPAGLEDYSLRVNVPLVSVDVSVLTKDGQFIPGLKKDNFRVIEDGVPQKVANFAVTEAPVTAVLLVEFANTNYAFINDMLNGAYSFLGSLKPEDWVAVVSYDMKPQTLVDFTQDKRAIAGALNTLRIPGFSETNMFDALYDTLDRIDGIEGRKYVILISSGRDTFSKLTYDKILNKVKNTQNVTIYAVGTGRAAREYYDARGALGSIARLDYLQADNELNTFAKMTGGMFYSPRFEAEFPEVFRDIAQTIRNQYTISYHPSNSKQDGSYRKLKVELVDDKGEPLKVQDQKGKNVKYQIIARDGYRAKQVVE